MDLTPFHPRSQAEADFLATFVVRHSTLDFFLRQLRLDPHGPSRHHLIVAPRGYGKTTLLRRIAIAVRTEPDLRRPLHRAHVSRATEPRATRARAA